MNLTYHWEIPLHLRLKINLKKVTTAVGRPVAKAIQRRVRGGAGARGKLPVKVPDLDRIPEGSIGRPLQDTGAMVKAIKYIPRKRSPGGRVEPFGYSAKGRPFPLVMRSILKRKERMAAADPMGWEQSFDTLARAAMAKELDRQAKKGELSLEGVGKRTIRGGTP